MQAQNRHQILSAYLNLLTAYPDQPYGHKPLCHPADGTPIVVPEDTTVPGSLLPKDEAVLEVVERKINTGEKVKPEKREAWVADHLSRGMQVLITNPTLVETGLDLNAFTTLIFYDTGYKLFTLRQASRRSWRINQTAPRVEVYLPYYQQTMQHKAMKLMASKLAVAGIIEGSFSEEGLAAMSECEDMTTMMAKELMLGIRDSVEDVAESFKRMALLKPKAVREPVLAELPPVEPSTPALEPAIEFAAVTPTPKVYPNVMPKPVKRSGRKSVSETCEEQIMLFQIA